MIGVDAPTAASIASRVLPLAGAVGLLVIGGIVRPIIQYRRHGTIGINVFNSARFWRNARDFLFILLFIALIAQGIVAARRVEPMFQLLIWRGALHDLLQIAGVLLVLGGLVLFAVAELHLGASWRVGIEEGANPGLVTAGLYAYTRNPIYLGILLTLAGYTALLPTRLSVLMLIGISVGLRIQAMAEEEYLLRTYGDAFRAYAHRVGRFVPWLGRL